MKKLVNREKTRLTDAEDKRLAKKEEIKLADVEKSALKAEKSVNKKRLIDTEALISKKDLIVYINISRNK